MIPPLMLTHTNHICARQKIDSKDPDVNAMSIGAGQKGMKSKKNYENPALVANYTREIAQMFKIIWTGQPIPNASLFENPDNSEYMEKAKLIAEFETKMINASPDPEVASETTVRSHSR